MILITATANKLKKTIACVTENLFGTSPNLVGETVWKFNRKHERNPKKQQINLIKSTNSP